MALINRVPANRPMDSQLGGAVVSWPLLDASASAQRVLSRSASLLTADVMAFVVAGAVAWFADSALHHNFATGGGVAPSTGAVATTLAVFAALVAYLVACSAYRQRAPYWSELRTMVCISLLGLLLNGFVASLLHKGPPGVLMFGTWIMFLPFAMVGRGAARRVLQALSAWHQSVVVVGSGATVRQAIDALRSEPRLGYNVVETVGPECLAGAYVGASARNLLARSGADLLILALDPTDRPHRRAVEALVRERIPFAVMPQLDGLPVLACEPTAFFSHDMVMLSYRNNLAHPLARFCKASFDVVLSATLLMLAAPLFAIIAAAVKLDGGPAFFVHSRIGAGGRRFGCLKFRSMTQDADAVLQRHLAADPAAALEWSSTQKLRHDPRITLVGRLLRKTSLDELPQLLNVLRLEMSLVGPRPIVTREVAKYGENISYYHEARPGLTGLWQVSGRSDTSYDRRVQLDCWYVKNWTMWHDLAIVAKTIPAVLKRNGAV